MNLFLYYPKCSSCLKIKKFLDEHHISYTERDIKSSNPSKDELAKIINKSKLPIRKFFNTSGILYRELSLKDKLDTMSFDEQLELLSSNGMLIKRPIFVSESKVIIGSRIKDYEAL